MQFSAGKPTREIGKEHHVEISISKMQNDHFYFLFFQLYSIITNAMDVKSVGLNTGSKLLNSLKSRVVYLSSATGVLLTVQQAAQAALQVGWSVLLPTANERAQTLSSLLPSTGKYRQAKQVFLPSDSILVFKGLQPSSVSHGHRFMTDLLVWSLMADGGLETALYEALRVEIAELADADETFEISSGHTTIPLLHLVKQLLR